MAVLFVVLFFTQTVLGLVIILSLDIMFAYKVIVSLLRIVIVGKSKT